MRVTWEVVSFLEGFGSYSKEKYFVSYLFSTNRLKSARTLRLGPFRICFGCSPVYQGSRGAMPEVRKTTRSLGISVVHGPTFLLVSDISEGVFHRHNSRSLESLEVIDIGSRIISVDGERGDGETLQKLMEDAKDAFELELLQYDG